MAWGTLVWANSPTKISPLNRANIISAAYAAFHPSEEILKKLNATLIQCQTSGKLSPEKCYFLKTNALALQILAQETQNDESRYSEEMPFEILKQLRKEGFQEGIEEKQKEVDQLVIEKDAVSIKLSIARQMAIIDSLKKDLEAKQSLLLSEKEKQSLMNSHIAAMKSSKARAEKKAKRRQFIFKIAVSVVCLCLVAAVCHLAKSTKYNWIVTSLGIIGTLFFLAVSIWSRHDVSPIKAINWAMEKISASAYSDYNFNPEEYSHMNQEYENSCEREKAIQQDIKEISSKLLHESAKIDSYSIDIDLLDTKC